MAGRSTAFWVDLYDLSADRKKKDHQCSWQCWNHHPNKTVICSKAKSSWTAILLEMAALELEIAGVSQLELFKPRSENGGMRKWQLSDAALPKTWWNHPTYQVIQKKLSLSGEPTGFHCSAHHVGGRETHWPSYGAVHTPVKQLAIFQLENSRPVSNSAVNECQHAKIMLLLVILISWNHLLFKYIQIKMTGVATHKTVPACCWSHPAPNNLGRMTSHGHPDLWTAPVVTTSKD